MHTLLIHPIMPPSYWSMAKICRLQGLKSLCPSLGLLTVAALLPREWEIRLVDENTHPVTDADWQWADLVLLSGMIVQTSAMLDIARRAKSWGKTVAAGGPGPSSQAAALLEGGCDLVIKGEAENLIAPLVGALQKGRSGVVLEASEKPALTDSPLPRFDLLKLEDYNIMPVQTTRGCPHDCEFCDVVNLYGQRIRKKNPDQVIAEIDFLYRLGWRRDIFFTDDNFIADREHALGVLNKLISWAGNHGKPFGFFTQTSVKLGQDRELIDLMTTANFWGVFIGIESLDEAALKQTRKFHNLQNPAVEAIKTIRDNGLDVIPSFILGFDGEQALAGKRIADLIEATQTPIFMVNKLTPIPNTRLWHRLAAEDRLLTENIGNNWDRIADVGADISFRPTRPKEEILAEYRKIWEDLMEPSAFLTRAYRYYLSMRPLRGPSQAQRTVVDNHAPGLNAKATVVQTWRNLLIFLKLSWYIGVAASSRRQYWRHIVGLWFRNPSRLYRYFNTVGFGLDMFSYREKILRTHKNIQSS